MTRRNVPRSAIVLALAFLALTGTLQSASADIGRSPARAALVRTDRYARREAKSLSTTYTLGTCKLLHRRPWLGYRCSYTMHRLADQCEDFLTVAVKRTATREYDATAVKWYGSGDGAPC